MYAEFDVAVTSTFVLSAPSPYPITGYGDGVLLGVYAVGVLVINVHDSQRFLPVWGISVV